MGKKLYSRFVTKVAVVRQKIVPVTGQFDATLGSPKGQLIAQPHRLHDRDQLVEPIGPGGAHRQQ